MRGKHDGSMGCVLHPGAAGPPGGRPGPAEVELAAGPEVLRADRHEGRSDLAPGRPQVDARGVVSRVEGADKLLKGLTAGDTGREKALAQALSEESLKASATQSLGLFPDGPVKPGESWERPVELKLGALGVVRLSRSLT